MKKILIFMGGFFPGQNYGGPPVSIDNFCSQFQGVFDTYIVTGNHDLGSDITYNLGNDWVNRTNCSVKYLSDKEWTYRKILELIIDLRPECIYLQSFFESFTVLCLIVAKKCHVPVLLAPRGELCDWAVNIKKYKKLPYIRIIKVLRLMDGVFFQATSKDERIGISRFFNNRVFELNNIPTISKIKKEYPEKIQGEAKFVFISRIVSKKNLEAAISYFMDIDCGRVKFDIYGSKEDEKYWNRCMDVMRKVPDNVLISYKGVVSHENISSIFSDYDAFLFPTYSENYGHVIAEALGVGCPVIISDQTIWNEVNSYKAGKAIPLAKRGEFVEFIKKIIDMNDMEIRQYRDGAIRLFEDKLRIRDLRNDYISAFDTICNDSQVKTYK